MAFTVKVTYEDGTVRSIARLFPDMPSAFAVQLADDIGRTYTPYRHSATRPVAVVIHDGAAATLAIRIFDGGLSPEPSFSGLVPLPSPGGR